MYPVVATARSKSSKNGDMPQVAIGDSKESARKSCAGCIHLEENTCYSHYGTVAMGFAGACKAKARGKDRSIRQAIANRADTARAIRLGSIGDPGAQPLSWHQKVRRMAAREDLAVLSYTHKWPTRPDLWEHCVASCDTLAEVDEALELGFRKVAVILPSDATEATTPNGVPVKICPAQTREGITCNQCLRCDAMRPGPQVTGFLAHASNRRKLSMMCNEANNVAA